jgi:fatty-acyl-CoA synthase
MSDEVQQSALSHTAGATDTPLLEQTIPDNLDATVVRFGDREALVDVQQGIRWTYREFSERVTGLARALVAAGVAKGDRVGIWAPNCAEWTLTQYATARIGAILVNINPSYRTHELEYVLKQAGISLLVAAAEFKTSNYAQMIDEVRSDCPDLREVVLIGTDSWDVLVARAQQVSSERVAEIQAGLEPDDPINIQYTSGTTGFPKGATLSHRNILNNGFFVGELCRYTEQDRVCIPVPFYHSYGPAPIATATDAPHVSEVMVEVVALGNVSSFKTSASDSPITSLVGDAVS